MQQLLEADALLTDADHCIPQAALLLENGRIAALGPRTDFPATPDCPHTRLPPRTILAPGLVNAHTHLEYGSIEGQLPPAPFLEWLPAMIAARRAITPDQAETATRQGLRRLARHGVTCVGDIVSLDRGRQAFNDSGLRHTRYLEIIDLAADNEAQAIDAVQARLEQLQPAAPRGRCGLSPHAPYSVSRPRLLALRRHFQQRQRLPFAIHLAESRSERSCLDGARGRLAARFRRAGLYPPAPQRPPLARDPLDFALAERVPDGPPELIIHGNHLSPAEWQALARAGNFHLAYCPGTRRWHDHREPVLARARRAGIPVTLGSDSLASNDRLNPWSEMRLALQQAPHRFTPAEAFRAATENAARALGWPDCGRLAPGLRADLIALDAGPQPLPDRPTPLIERLLAQKPSPPLLARWIDGLPLPLPKSR